MHKWLYLLLATLLLAGCSPGSKGDSSVGRPLLIRTAAGPVLSVGGEIVTGDDVIGSVMEHNGSLVPVKERFKQIAQTTEQEQFKRQARAELEGILDAKLASVLLYGQAKKEMEGKGNVDEILAKQIDSEVRRFVTARFGGDYARAEQYLKNNDMDWKRLREQKKETIVTQYYISSQSPEPRPVHYDELVARYNELKQERFAVPATIRFEMLDIQSSVLDFGETGESRHELAREFAHVLTARIHGGEDLGTLARQYRGVSLVSFSEAVRPESLARPFDVLARQAEQMAAGNVSQPIETPDGDHIFIMKLLEKQLAGFKPLAEVQRQVEQTILDERRARAIGELEARFRKHAQFAEKDEFVDLCLEKIYRLSNT
ncbi:MAG: peptidylprolyl isomerase [Planctomycetota bacterium]|jgi:hypothetical protein